MAIKDRLGHPVQGQYLASQDGARKKECMGGLTSRWNYYVLELADRVSQVEEEMFDGNVGVAEAKRLTLISEAYEGPLPVDDWRTAPNTRSDKALTPYPVSPSEPVHPQLGYAEAFKREDVTREQWYAAAVTRALGGDWYPLCSYFDTLLAPGIQSYIRNTFDLPPTDASSWRATTCEDILQIVREKTVQFLPQLTIPQPHAFSAWCYRVARNAAVDLYRRRPLPEVRLVEIMAQENDRVIISLDERAMLHDVRRALLALESDQQRDALSLHSFGGYSNAEIAAFFGKHEGAVKSLKHRGRDSLARALKIRA